MHSITLKWGKEIPSHRPSTRTMRCRHRTPSIAHSFGIGLSLGLALALPGSAEQPGFDLTGSWYVLIHYRENAGEIPESERWEDRIWIFETQRKRLKWTEYGIVLFENERGRYQSLASGRQIKAEGAWSPDAEQLLEIAAGIEVNGRGARTKNLRGGPEQGYRSSGSMRNDSVSVIGFSETWEVVDPTGLPTFKRTDVMDSGRSDSLQGVTQFRSSTRDPETDTIEGDFARDEAIAGRFKMMRAGQVSPAAKKDTR